MYVAIKEAVDRARAGGGPTFIEALTYRLGAHSSSDDPTRYRDEAEPEAWREKDPLVRFRKLAGRPAALLSAAERGRPGRRARARDPRRPSPPRRRAAPPALSTLIEDVYAEPTWILREQLADLERVRARRRGVADARPSPTFAL